jgi:biopolymer transport protein ExbB
MPVQNFLSLGGVVMIPLIALSILALMLILERLIFWGRITGRQTRIAQEAIALYARNPAQAFQLLKRNQQLPIARVFLAALQLEQANPDDFRLALETAAQAELPTLKRFNTIFETVISVAPLLGLLGTILGLMEAFAALRVGDIGGTETLDVTAGISRALISTASGLVVAISTLFFANLFRGLYLRQRALILEYGGHLELLHRRYHRAGGAPYAAP